MIWRFDQLEFEDRWNLRSCRCADLFVRLLYVRCRKAFKLLGIGSGALKVLRYRSGVIVTMIA